MATESEALPIKYTGDTQVELMCVGTVSGGGNDEADEYTPDSGKELHVLNFIGDAAFSKNAAVLLIWRYDHATESEVIKWSTKGAHNFQRIVIPSSEVDGVRKLAVVCRNDESGDLIMSGYAEIDEI